MVKTETRAEPDTHLLVQGLLHSQRAPLKAAAGEPSRNLPQLTHISPQDWRSHMPPHVSLPCLCHFRAIWEQQTSPQGWTGKEIDKSQAKADARALGFPDLPTASYYIY